MQEHRLTLAGPGQWRPTGLASSAPQRMCTEPRLRTWLGVAKAGGGNECLRHVCPPLQGVLPAEHGRLATSERTFSDHPPTAATPLNALPSQRQRSPSCVCVRGWGLEGGTFRAGSEKASSLTGTKAATRFSVGSFCNPHRRVGDRL